MASKSWTATSTSPSPPDLWVDYIDPAFRDVAPRKMSMNGRSETWHCLGKPLPAFIDRPERQRGLDIRNEIAPPES